MDKAFEYRIYPNAAQRGLIERTFGCCRYVYNRALAIRKEAYGSGSKAPSVNDCIKMLPGWKADAGTSWLGEVDAAALQQSLRDLDKAYRNFFRSPGKAGHPRFKSKRAGRMSYRTPANGNSVRVEAGSIRLPKLGSVKMRCSRPVEGRILSVTVKRVPTGKYFACVCCTDVPAAALPRAGKAVGIDLGIDRLITTSDGAIVANARPLASLGKRLAREQRRLSRKAGARKGERPSNNYIKQRKRVARIHERIADQRKDAAHKATTALINENQVIVAETLRPANMVKNHCLAKSISDAAFGEIARQLEYKADWYGREFVRVGAFFPSSKTCSSCGHVQDMPLGKRTYACPECGMAMDRDVNAAVNILAEGLRLIGWGTPESNACGEGVSRCA